jgi:molybdate transport system substrate-binding protein
VTRVTASGLLLLVLLPAPGAQAAEIKIWTARAIATVLAEIGPEFERATGHTLVVTSDLPAVFLKRAAAGEPFDMIVTGVAPLEALIKDGRVVASSRAEISRSGIGVAVRAGARKPDISSVDVFKRALLDAKSVAYLKNVGSGLYVAGLLERLGIAEAVQAKATRPETDIVSELVARGDVELGLVVITQILTTPGVELAGPLPPEIQSYVVFTAGVGTRAQQPEGARALVTFLHGPLAERVIRAQGMEPGGR